MKRGKCTILPAFGGCVGAASAQSGCAGTNPECPAYFASKVSRCKPGSGTTASPGEDTANLGSRESEAFLKRR